MLNLVTRKQQNLRRVSSMMVRLSFFFVLSFVLLHFAFADTAHDERDLIVDKELANLEMGATISKPGQYEKGVHHPALPGSSLSPRSDTGAALKSSGATPSSPAGGNLGAGNPPGLGVTTPAENNPPASGETAEVTEPSGETTTGGITEPTEETTGGTTVDTGPGGSADSGAIIEAEVSTDVTGEPITIDTDAVSNDSNNNLLDVEASTPIADVDLEVAHTEETSALVGDETKIGAEIDASGSTTGTETDTGVEADVDGTVSDDTVVADSADGLTAPTTPSL